MRRSTQVLQIAASFALLVGGPRADASERRQAQEPPALADIDSAAERARVEQLIEAARQKGALRWIGVQFDASQTRIILDAFRRHYGLDDLAVEYKYASTGEIIDLVEAGMGADPIAFDIVWTSSWSWYRDLHGRGEILHYASPSYSGYILSDRLGLSEPGYWVSDAIVFAPLYVPSATAQRGLPDFEPTSWADFVDPRLAGATFVIDPMVSTSAAPALAGVTRVMGDDWLRRLGANRLAVHRSGAHGRAQVASGEQAVTLFGTPADALLLRGQGIDAKLLYPGEGVMLIPFAPVILRRAEHPNAARLFIDFVRSAHGTQIAMADEAGALLFFGRPGTTSRHPDLQPIPDRIRAIPFDWDTEGSQGAMERLRVKARAAGIGQ